MLEFVLLLIAAEVAMTNVLLWIILHEISKGA